MEFQLKYYKKDSIEKETIEIREFKNLSACKRWYKKQFDKGFVEYPMFSGWDYENNKAFYYTIKSYFRR